MYVLRINLYIIQEAVTRAFQYELENLNELNLSYLKSLSKSLQVKRDRMQNILQEFGFKTILPHGGYFMIADASNIGCLFFYIFLLGLVFVLYISGLQANQSLCTVNY